MQVRLDSVNLYLPQVPNEATAERKSLRFPRLVEVEETLNASLLMVKGARKIFGFQFFWLFDKVSGIDRMFA